MLSVDHSKIESSELFRVSKGPERRSMTEPYQGAHSGILEKVVCMQYMLVVGVKLLTRYLGATRTGPVRLHEATGATHG